tara:strand:- start:4 stop:153 length:150 start_codon:yes stop_codon:yes gene_type:complete
VTEAQIRRLVKQLIEEALEGAVVETRDVGTLYGKIQMSAWWEDNEEGEE